MKHRFVLTVGTLALALSVAGTAQAQHKRCDTKALEGSWAYTETGTIVLPTTPPTPAPTVAVGRYTFDRDGTLTAIQWASTLMNPPGVYGTKTGTYTLNEDCTFTMEINGYDALGNLVRYSEWQIVLADNGREMRGISLKLFFSPNPPTPPWVDLKPVLTKTGTPTRDKGQGR